MQRKAAADRGEPSAGEARLRELQKSAAASKRRTELRPDPKVRAVPAKAVAGAHAAVAGTGVPIRASARMPSRSGARGKSSARVAKPKKTSFQEVMQESLTAPMSKSHRPEAANRAAIRGPMKEKSVAMHLRASIQEHAMIQAGAEQAGVTVAEYMRQCTLDVQVLRALLNQTIADRNLASIAAPSKPQLRLGTGEESGMALRAPDSFLGEPEESFVSRLKVLLFGARRR